MWRCFGSGKTYLAASQLHCAYHQVVKRTKIAPLVNLSKACGTCTDLDCLDCAEQCSYRIKGDCQGAAVTWEGMHETAMGDNLCNCMLDLRVIARME